jgi:hypothetical protein
MRGRTEEMRALHRGAWLGAALVLAAGTGAVAQGLPTPLLQEVLVKTNLLSFNDAITNDNFTVFHMRLSKPFRDQFPPERLRQTFKEFVEKRASFDVIAAKPAIPIGEAKIDNEGVLRLNGYFETTPKQVKYQLGFIRSEGDWKLSSINVQIESPSQ